MVLKIVELSLRQRALVLLAALVLLGVGAWSSLRLPIDSVADITNPQVLLNTAVPALAPEEIEKLVTLPIESQCGRKMAIGLVEISIPQSVTTVGIAEHEFGNVPTGLHETAIFPGEAGLLGNGLLSRFSTVTIDAKAGCVILGERRSAFSPGRAGSAYGLHSSGSKILRDSFKGGVLGDVINSGQGRNNEERYDNYEKDSPACSRGCRGSQLRGRRKRWRAADVARSKNSGRLAKKNSGHDTRHD